MGGDVGGGLYGQLGSRVFWGFSLVLTACVDSHFLLFHYSLLTNLAVSLC